MNKERRIIYIILLGIVGFTVISGMKWFTNNFEKQEVERLSGYSAEARLNKFLAAEHFLRNLGYEVESDSNRARLLESHTSNTTILINDYGPKLSPTHFEMLKDWLEAGGHLIFTANHFDYNNHDNNELDEPFTNNQLLEEYGIIPVLVDYDEEKNNSDVSEYSTSDNTTIKLDFFTTGILLDTKEIASFALRDNYGAHLLQFDIGDGKLTVLSDNYLFSNDAISEHDHAYLLSVLGQVNTSDEKKFLLLYNNESDSIFSLIWRYGKEACIAFLALLILSLWSMRNRFGPIKPNISFKHRNITEHLHALARFSWRQDHGVHLLNQSRLVCEHNLLKRYPVLKIMSTQERLEHLAKTLDMQPDMIHSALYFTPQSTSEFINSSHYLQKIWILQ